MKVNCDSCGTTILKQTAAKTGGLCMPCFKGTREPAFVAMTLEEVENSYGFPLPAGYKRFLDRNPQGSTVELEQREWKLRGLERIARQQEVHGSTTRPNFACLRQLTSLAEEFAGQNYSDSPDGPVLFARVRKGFVIGDDNGDYLYLDPDDAMSVWIFYHDGFDVERVARHFGDWADETHNIFLGDETSGAPTRGEQPETHADERVKEVFQQELFPGEL